MLAGGFEVFSVEDFTVVDVEDGDGMVLDQVYWMGWVGEGCVCADDF